MDKKLKVVYKKLAELIPYVNNTRTHSDTQVLQIASSIKEFGFTNPILIDEEGGVIAGHGRIMGAKKLGLEEAPTITLKGLTEAQRKAYIIADNKLALNSGWDEELLKVELQALDEIDFDLSVIGFDEDELSSYLGDNQLTEGLTDEDDVPEPPEKPVTREGDVWLLGNHRLMCGDSTSVDAVEKLMNGEKASCVFTSPPYNANTNAPQGDVFNKKKNMKLYSSGYEDNRTSSEYVDFCESVLDICFIHTDGFIFWNVSYNANSRNQFIKQIVSKLDYMIEFICWKKSATIPFKGSLMRDFEPIYLFSTNGKKLGLGEVCSNHWEISNISSQTDTHKACFPVELPVKGLGLINGDLVFEPFGGSGTTMIASEKLGKRANLMEIDPKYCDVIIKRWQDFTGKQATLEIDGRTFEEVSND